MRKHLGLSILSLPGTVHAPGIFVKKQIAQILTQIFVQFAYCIFSRNVLYYNHSKGKG